MDAAHLPIPAEPLALRALGRTLLEQAPDDGLPLIASGGWIADALWGWWQAPLERGGMDRARFDRVVADYGNELRLWAIGERPWDQCAGGLAGRVSRRLRPATPVVASTGDGPCRAWDEALGRIGLAAGAAEDDLTGAVERLRLLHEVDAQAAPTGGRLVHRAVVWAGARPRDPEAPRGEGTSDVSRADALAEALGRFLLKDPAYPPAPRRHAEASAAR